MLIKKLIKPVILISAIITGISIWQIQTSSLLPEINFRTLDGKTIKSSDLKGKPLLISFWAPDCPSCIEEIPELISLHEQFKDQGLIIIAVAMHYSPPDQIVNFIHNKKIPYISVLDPNAEISNILGNIQLTPTTFIVDRSGKITMQIVGAFDKNKIIKLLNQL